MTQILCAVHDAKADMFKYSNYSVYANKEIAIRVFKTQLSVNEIMAHSKEDFRLYKLADITAETGQIKPLDVVELLYDGASEVVVK